MYRVAIKNETIYSCSFDRKVKAWSILDNELKYEISQGNSIYDFVIGHDGTPLNNRIVSISFDKTCRISNLENGAVVKTINFESYCWTIAVDKAQTMIAIGTNNNVTFIETTSFTKVKEVPMNTVYSLAFNKRNDGMLAVTKYGEIHSFKF